MLAVERSLVSVKINYRIQKGRALRGLFYLHVQLIQNAHRKSQHLFETLAIRLN